MTISGDSQDLRNQIASDVGFDDAGCFSLEDPNARVSLTWLGEVLSSAMSRSRIHQFAPPAFAGGPAAGLISGGPNSGGLISGGHTVTDPRAHLPGAKSVVSVALSFNSAIPESTTAADSDGIPAKLARYSAHKDYHNVVDSMLSALERRLAEAFGQHNRFLRFCDAGPIVDRHMAVMAGIGYYGKNCSVINPKLGSWTILGGLVTTIDIETPVSPRNAIPVNNCGNCELCIRACPTGALEAPFRINPSRCLSGITQMRGSMGEEFRTFVGNRLFGCDTCQEVCPKNAGAAKVFHPNLIVNDEFRLMRKADQVLRMSQQGFSRDFSMLGSGWRGRNTLRRNAAIICGNSGNPEAIPLLEASLQDPSPVIRSASAWALEKLQRSGDG